MRIGGVQSGILHLGDKLSLLGIRWGHCVMASQSSDFLNILISTHFDQ